MRNPLKDKLRRGEAAIGTWVGLGHPDVTERLSTVGFDWLLLDGEHGPLSLETMQMMMQAMRGETCVPLIRVEWNDPVIIKRALDLGPAGIIIPQVNTREEAVAAVRACKYPPAGIRGCGPRRAALVYDDYIATANDALLIVVQIESQQAVQNVAEILAVDGVDCVFIGPVDLCMDMYGVPGKWGDPKYMAAFDTVVAAAKKAGKTAGLYGSTRNIERALNLGFRLCSVDSAEGFLVSGARVALAAAGKALGKRE